MLNPNHGDPRYDFNAWCADCGQVFHENALDADERCSRCAEAHAKAVAEDAAWDAQFDAEEAAWMELAK